MLVQGVLVALRSMDALADQLLAFSGEHAKGRLGVEGRPIKVLLCWLKLTLMTFRLNISKARFTTSRRLIPCLLPARGRRKFPLLLMMRFHNGLLALCVRRSLTLVPCEQDSIVCRVVKDRARRRVKIVTHRKGGSRFGGGRRHLAKSHQWVRHPTTNSTGVGLQGSEE